MNACLQDPEFYFSSTPDSGAVHALHQRVLASEPDGMARPDSLEHFAQHEGNLGRLIGCFREGGALIAYGVLALDLPVVTAFSSMLGVDMATLSVLDGSAVHPDWRGRRLHEAMISERLRLAAGFGRPHAVATCAPQNIYSLRGLLRAGFEIRHFELMYGAMPRFVVYRPATGDLLRPQAQPRHTALSLTVADLPGHQAALAAGLVGHGCRQSPQGNWHVDYSSPGEAG